MSGMQAEKNLAWEAAQAQNASMLQINTMATAGSGPCKLYINNLHPNIQVCPVWRRLPLLQGLLNRFTACVRWLTAFFGVGNHRSKT